MRMLFQRSSSLALPGRSRGGGRRFVKRLSGVGVLYDYYAATVLNAELWDGNVLRFLSPLTVEDQVFGEGLRLPEGLRIEVAKDDFLPKAAAS